jgi:hypothetical protein
MTNLDGLLHPATDPHRKTKLERVTAVLSGGGDEEIRRELSDPMSEASQLMEAVHCTFRNALSVNCAKIDDGDGFAEYMAETASLRRSAYETSEV